MRQLVFVFLFLGAFVSSPNHLTAQWLEAGFTVGGSNYLGDLVDAHLAPNEYNIAFGAFGRYQWTKYISFKGYVNRAELSGSDANNRICLLYTSPSPRDATLSRMPSSA